MSLPDLNQSQYIAFGVFLIALGSSFGWKFYQALVEGRLLIRSGWLPFTLVFPFVSFLPRGNNSHLQWKKGIYVRLLMGPIFFFLTVVCLAPGIVYIGFDNTESVNRALTGGKPGVAPAITFGKRTGYSFPFFPHAVAHFRRLLLEQFETDSKPLYYIAH